MTTEGLFANTVISESENGQVSLNFSENSFNFRDDDGDLCQDAVMGFASLCRNISHHRLMFGRKLPIPKVRDATEALYTLLAI